MGPAQTMGTFLRVWRSEWAGLSRAQLAIALHALSPKTKGVTPRVIRRWEEGQAPATTEELEALLTVMRTHGLSAPEVKQFRTAVFAACLDRHYPEAFTGEDFAQRRDVDDAALSLYFTLCIRPWEQGVVQGVACLEALRAETADRLHPGASGPQRRRQEMALALLHSAFSGVHGHFGRYRLAADAAAVGRTIVDQRFNGRLTYWITADTLRAEQLQHTGYLTGSSAVVPELLKLYHRAVAEGDQRLLGRAIGLAVDCLPMTDQRDWPVVVRSLGDAHLASAKAIDGAHGVAIAHLCQAGAALELGAWADVERHLRGFDHWHSDESMWCRLRWENYMGVFARKRGDWTEAIEHFGRTLPLLDLLGDHGHADWNRTLIRDCHDQQEKANRRKARAAPTMP